MSAGKSFVRKRNRLEHPIYRQHYVCSLTIVTADRLRVLASSRWASDCVAELRRASEKHQVSVLAFCVMPDHLHILAHNVGGDIVHFVKDFKQFTGYRYKQATGNHLWQKSYHDHFLRHDEDVLSVARYILANPVRAGLVQEASQYAFSGSFAWGRAVVEA